MEYLTAAELHALVARLATLWQSDDLDAGFAQFADDAVLITPSRHYNGRDEIIAAMRDFWRDVSLVRITLRRSVADEGQQRVALEWRWSETDRVTGRVTEYDDAIVGQLRNGKIVYWREYITPKYSDTSIDRHDWQSKVREY